MDDNGGFESLFEIDPSKLRRPKISRSLVTMIVGGLAALTILMSTFYQVQPEEVGVILRFGKFIKVTEPGLHMKAPFIETMLPVQVQRQLKQEDAGPE